MKMSWSLPANADPKPSLRFNSGSCGMGNFPLWGAWRGSCAVIGACSCFSVLLWGLIGRAYCVQGIVVVVFCGHGRGSLVGGAASHCPYRARSRGRA